MASLLLSNSLDDIQAQIALSIALVIAICKVNICMSVCLHRYAAHSAFKCGYMTNIVLCTLGCLANQGGPIWWASQHRCHHKYCDVDRDPHSPVLDGSELAFSFFENPKHENVEEEFVPVHLNGGRESIGMRVMDTWSWLVVFCELCLSYIWFGRDGLFICYTSGWLCQTITLWFNVVNHPPDRKKDDNVNQTTNSSSSSINNGEKNKNRTKSGVTDACRASDGKDTIFDDFYIPFMFLDFLVPIFSFFVNESEHGHHHTHAKLAKRSRFDVAYWGFVWPLEQLGLVWDVVV
jgi:fatty-acid desaturase